MRLKSRESGGAIAGLALTTLLVGAAQAQDLAALPTAEAYDRCMTTAHTAPATAVFEAEAWQAAGGGNAARHCAAVALAVDGKFAEAAERLEALANDMNGDSGTFAAQTRAQVLGQAGRAWLQARRASRAYAAVTAALALTPNDVELLIDRSEALAAAENYWESLDDLNRALEIDPRRIDALVFRAAAYRLVDALDLSRDDLNRALALDPRNPEALLELGIVRFLDGDRVGAEQAWQAVIAADPDSIAAADALTNMDRLKAARP